MQPLFVFANHADKVNRGSQPTENAVHGVIMPVLVRAEALPKEDAAQMGGLLAMPCILRTQAPEKHSRSWQLQSSKGLSLSASPPGVDPKCNMTIMLLPFTGMAGDVLAITECKDGAVVHISWNIPHFDGHGQSGRSFPLSSTLDWTQGVLVGVKHSSRIAVMQQMDWRLQSTSNVPFGCCNWSIWGQ